MNRKLIAGILSAALVISGVFAVKAYAEDNNSTQTGQEITEKDIDRGFFGCGGFGFGRGFGFMRGFFGNLTDDQISKLEPLKEKALDILNSHKDEMSKLREELQTAMKNYDKAGILSADKKMDELRDKEKTELDPIIKEAAGIIGKDVSELNLPQFKDRNDDFIAQLEKATTQDEIKSVIDSFKGGFGRGFGKGSRDGQNSGFQDGLRREYRGVSGCHFRGGF